MFLEGGFDCFFNGHYAHMAKNHEGVLEFLEKAQEALQNNLFVCERQAKS